MNEFFRRVAVGSPWAFLLAVRIVLGWAATGPIYGYSVS